MWPGQCQRGQLLFDAIEARFDPPPGIREIIALQRAKGCHGPSARWEGRLKLGRGSDSNANQGASNPNFSIGQGSGVLNLVLSPEFTPHRDRFNQITLDGAVSGLGNGWQGYAQLQNRRYDTSAVTTANPPCWAPSALAAGSLGRTAGRQRWPHPPGRRKLSTLRHHQRLAGPAAGAANRLAAGLAEQLQPCGVSVALAF